MYGLLLLGVGAATTSCEDMFTAENKLVTTDLEPQEQGYQLMGIVKRMQKLADRTVLLGEIRADLIDVNKDVASTDLQQLYDNNIDADNVYNNPADYYDVINNCNIYLAYVDDQLELYGSIYYEKEIAAVKCFRAWCYLELVKIYGSVPFITDPVLTAEDAEDIVASGKKADMVTILDFCIADLEEELSKNKAKNLAMRPDLGAAFWKGGSVDSKNFFIPVRPLLAELYLWRGAYEGKSDTSKGYYLRAVNLYHEYFCFPGEERAVRNYVAEWSNRDHEGVPFYSSSSSYSSMRFYASATDENVAILPCDTATYYGNISKLGTVFNSQYSNNYYPWIVPSARLSSISAAPQYCYVDLSNTKAEIIKFSSDPSEYQQASYVGDLRYAAVYQTESNYSNSKDNANYNASRSWVTKWTGGGSFPKKDEKVDYIPFFRTTILYLHMAEALNRAGFPETAFAVLKYGLTKEVMEDRSKVSKVEFDALSKIKVNGFDLKVQGYSDDMNNSFVVWPSMVFYNPNNLSNSGSHTGTLAQIGIHSLGSGCSELNDNYFLATDSLGIIPVPAILPVPEIVNEPGKMMTYEEWCEENNIKTPNLQSNKNKYETYKTEYNEAVKKYEQWLITYPAALAEYNESVRVHDEAVAYNAAWLASDEVRTKRMDVLSQMILEEEALEGMFEGQRFYDLMRYQMQEGQLQGGAVGATISIPWYRDKYGDGLRGGMDNRQWYLKLPTR